MNTQLAEVPGTGETQEGEEEPRLVDNDLIRKDIQKAFKEMEEIDVEREDLNAQAGEVRARMKNKGIPTKAFNAAYNRYKMDEDKREAHDFAFSLCCKATGVGYQVELWEDQDKTKH